MSTKRKRPIEEVENSQPGGTPVSVKKKKGRMSKEEKQVVTAELRKARGVFDVLRTPRGGSRDVCEHFVRTPSRRQDPQYYKDVKSPIDLTRIQQKINNEEYRTFDEFCEDVELLVENSKNYYKENSEEHKDAMALFDIYKEAKNRVEKGIPFSDDEDDGASTAASSIEQAHSISSGRVSRLSNVSEESIEPLWVDDILCGILELTDKSGRLIAPPFRVLLPKEEFPIYYDKIKNPIDLKRIAQKGRAGEYKVMSELGADIRLLCKNAQQFSGKNSEIYKDASAIVDFYKEKSEQVMEKGVHNRRREKCVNQVNQLLAQEASNMDVDYSEDSEEDEDMKDSTDPLWKLYWLLRNEPDPKSKGTLLSDPFVELPAKSCYPDYYDEIKQPMSFFMIHKILKRGGYSTLMDLLKDCMQIFANACEYNVEGSSVYVAAKKLETLALKKAAELQPSLDLTFFETKPVIQVINTTPKVKGTPKTLKIKAEPLDSSSDEKDSYGTPPPSKKKWTPRKQRPISTGMTAEHLAAPGRPGRKSMDELMLRYRQKLVVFWDLLYNFKEGAYWPVGAFMELPRMKEYPDYYDVIAQPIDMREIRRKIETNKYESSSHLMADFELMFNNARTFNDPGSQIANDASRLENMVITAHGNTKDAPIESPLALKEKFGWLRTKLTEPRRRRGENGLQTPTSNTSFFNGSNGISDDDSSNSSIRSPAPMSHLPIPKSKGKNDKNKMETMISRLPPDQQRMWRLFNHLRDYHDEEGRKLSTAFLRLPTREEYPDYYEVIKKPMDMQRIQQRLNGQGYSSWTDIVADFSLMLDNACKYNETDSQIYKDAVSLQRVLLEKKMELGATDDSMPRVQVEIRNMFMTIFHSVFSKKDSKGRCRSDSFADLPDILKSKGIGIDEQPFTFDQIKRNIDKSRYRRLDRFQKDFFDLFEKARQHSAPDSKLFEDAEELQLVFVRERDTHCKAILVSDAYGIVEGKVREECEILRKQKLKNSEHTQELERRESTDDIAKEAGDVELTDLTIGDHVYTTPCYVYVARTDDNPRGPPHIMRVERIFKNQNGDNMVRGLWVYRPNETLHLPKRRFLEKEVFLTPFQDNALAERLQGPCQVVSLKTYVNNEIADVEPKDLYVCESKYLGKPRYFAKIKNWEYADEDAKLKMEKREKPLDPVSVPLSYVKAENEVEDGQSSQTSSSSEEDDRLRESVILDIERIEVRSSQEPDADGRSYFCQMLTKAGRHYACGDFVLVFNPQRPYCDVMRIDKLWREADGNEWFSGGWFARPSDVTHDPGRMFYVREVFAVYQSDQTRRVDDIQNHCAVLTTKEYIKQRPTEVPECDVFVCENKIAGKPVPNGEVSSIFPTQLHNKETDEVPTGEPLHIDSCVLLKRIKTYKNGNQVVDPELFLFKQPIAMEKEMSPLLKNDVAVPLDPLDMDMLDEDTDGAESVTSSKPEMNNWLANQPKLTAKSKSGYILFSAEIRKRIMHENPEAGFGEVSKIVGIEWKKLSEEQKRQYEVRAEFIASERQKQEAARAAVKDQLLPGQIRVYHCKWANCDSQFDQENGLYEHIVQHHTSQIILDSDNQYVCMWITCLRNRKDGKPFPSLPRLHRHMKEKHVNSSVRNLYQNQIGRNFYKLVTTPGPSGENYQLVHLPHARGMTGAPSGQQQNQSTPAPHLNGHPTAVVVNGDHHGPPHIHHQTPHHPAQVQYSHQQPSSSHHPQQGHPSSSQHVPQAEAGRLVVKMPPGAEPVFVHMPSSFMSRRVLHSESYLRYIESLSNNRQRTVSHWERNLNSNYRNMNPQHQQGQKKNLPVHWIKQDTAGRNVVPEDDVVKALWRLRDQMLESSLGMSTERNYQGLL